ncbi:hypothetical protein NBO_8g0005 [Nosema bombycis CQ1]|uniref:Uncharacterized protein n=1 Tax=Nosema bombycis (strain CQ1 / CVCC 102059) TaxID=578461 RepID=R0MLL4_NOSB1|nr:hypothetical protein NBO_8g0005 [Nosema bombycis CQ1]|eukprot:EOB15140.1 hypothetical protein NBO_8g0005 [Nosema bombycis CQ1]
MIIRTRDEISGVLMYNRSFIVYGTSGFSTYDQTGNLYERGMHDIVIQNILQNSKHLAVVSKERVFIIEKITKYQKDIEKENLDYVVLTENRLLIIKSNAIQLYSVLDCKVQNSIESNDGLCVDHVFYNDILFLAFENGCVKTYEEGELTILKIFLEVNKMITSFDKNQYWTIIGTFCKFLIKFNDQGHLIKQTVLENHPIKIRIWNENIFILDSENNFIKLNSELELIHCRNYGGILKTFNVVDNEIVIIYTTGTVFIGNELPQIGHSKVN